jgi:hypothetical protein
MAGDDLDFPVDARIGPGPAGGSSWRVSRRQAVLDSSTKRLLLIAGGVGGTLLLLVGAYSLRGHHAGGIPVVEADPRPLREKPKNPGGMEIAGADDSILNGGSGKEATAPPPETPEPGALLAQERSAQAAEKAAAEKAAAAARPVAPPAVAAAAPSSASASAPAPVSVPAAPAPVVTASAPPEPRPVAPSRPAAVARPLTPPSGSGATQVQLAALPSEEAAMTEWARLSHRMPDMLGARHPAVSRTEHDGKVWFRLRTGGFADVADATAFCQRVREKGGGCSLASF